MANASGNAIRSLLTTQEKELLAEWIQTQLSATSMRGGSDEESELREQSREFLNLFKTAAQGSMDRIDGANWEPCAGLPAVGFALACEAGIHADRDRHVRLLAQAAAVCEPVRHLGNDRRLLADEMWTTTDVLDRLGLYTTEMYQKGREEVITRQQQELMELSTPVVKLWDNVLALPLIGTLDSERTQVVMENAAAADRRDRRDDRDHRHHGRADGRHAGRAAPHEDDRGRAADGCGLHHQRHPPADRADDRASGRRTCRT